MPEDLPIRYQLRKFAEVYRAFTQLAQKLRPPGPQELAMPDFQMEVTVPPNADDGFCQFCAYLMFMKQFRLPLA